jgi:perosamine synthetase
MKIVRNQGMDPNVRYYFSHIGYNYRMTNIAAAILVGQLERLSEMWDRRCELYASYRNILNDFDFLQLQDPVQDEIISPWLFPVLLDNGARRGAVIEHLSSSGIDSRPFFIPIHSLPIYREVESQTTFELTNSISNRGMNLPTSSAFTADEIMTLLSGVKSAFEHA